MEKENVLSIFFFYFRRFQNAQWKFATIQKLYKIKLHTFSSNKRFLIPK